MQKKKTILIALIGMSLIGYFVFTNSYSIYGNRLENVVIKKQEFKLEIVSSRKKMEKGLATRNNLCENCGMLFKFETAGRYPFWMKDMQFPLDIIWILQNRIVYMEESISQFSTATLDPIKDADTVLELNAGSARKLDLKVGDIVEL